MKHAIGTTRGGTKVYVELIFSKAAGQISHQPRLLTLIDEILKKAEFTDETVYAEYDLGRPLGYDFVVETSDKDTIFYAQLVKDTVYTRFVKTGQPLATQHVTMLLHRDEKGNYELDDTWIGRLSPPRPGSENETATSRTFWDNHALIFDHQPIQSRTLSKTCPW